MLEHINPQSIPASPFYSHGVVVTAPRRTLYTAGQVGVGADGVPASGMQAQAAQAIANLKAILAAADMTVSDVVKLTIFLTDEALVGEFMAAGASLLASPPAATTLLFVKALASPDLLIEIEAVAAK